LALVNVVKGPQGLKKYDFQKVKLTPPGIHPSLNSVNVHYFVGIYKEVDCMKYQIYLYHRVTQH